jgi:hypothetical protein
MCVDVWHFKNKHAVTHEYCQLHCNSAKYPKLLKDDDLWWFNTSVTEQTNAWLGGYHSILCEMHVIKYNFFLDKMIHLWNIQVIKHLAERGHSPHSPHSL